MGACKFGEISTAPKFFWAGVDLGQTPSGRREGLTRPKMLPTKICGMNLFNTKKSSATIVKIIIKYLQYIFIHLIRQKEKCPVLSHRYRRQCNALQPIWMPE